MRAEIDAMERELEENTPEGIERRQKREQARFRRARSIQAQGVQDATKLLKQPEFIRWLFTELELAGIFTPTFHAQKDSEQFAAGVRAFGLALTNRLEAIDPAVMVSVMMERAKTLEKAPHERDPD